MQIKNEEHSEEEGFFPNHFEVGLYPYRNIKGHVTSGHQGVDKVPFATRFLSGNGYMIKQPSLALKTIHQCKTLSNHRKPEKKKKNQPLHPYFLYAKNQQYQLIYNKNKGDPIHNNIQFMKNQVILQHLGGKSLTHSKGIKQFSPSLQKLSGDALILDSRFQSGNLHCAYKHKKNQEYVGFIQNDTNSLGYNQWFYFSVQGNKPKTKYHFKLVNFKKKHSFFKYGYLPAIFSKIQAQQTGQGWCRKGQNVIYEESPIHIPSRADIKYYCLSFQVQFEHENDYIMIAMGLPYSYTKMVNHLNNCLVKQIQNVDFSVTSIAKTICGNDVPQITITSTEGKQDKKMIIIMARQHPGEVWSSYMVEGMIQGLLNPKSQQKWLLQNYIVKIYPMINVDGVIYGNFRCDVTGVDLNRRWKEASKILQPQIFEIKNKISEYSKKYKIELCYDLHGHSKDYNIFCYSCKMNIYSCRVLPLLISKNNQNFHFPSCTFGISPYKESTARATIFKIIQNQNVLTIQSSFYGSKINNQIKNFEPKDLYKMGRDILKSSRYFLDKESKQYLAMKRQVEERIKQFIQFDKLNENNSGSDSEPQADEIDYQTKVQKIFKKNVIPEKLQKVKKAKTKAIKIEKSFDEDQKEQLKEKQKVKLNPKPELKELTQIKRSSKTIDVQKLPDPKQNHITISLSNNEQLTKKASKTIDAKKSNTIFRKNKKNFSIHHSYDGTKSKKKIHKEIIQQEQIKQLKEEGNEKQFKKKFSKFIPISMLSHHGQADPFNENLYQEDQTTLINTLIQNKRKIQLEKIKRDIEKSTYIVERQGKIKSKIEKKSQHIVDFRKFKENDKAGRQIRQLRQRFRYND